MTYAGEGKADLAWFKRLKSAGAQRNANLKNAQRNCRMGRLISSGKQFKQEAAREMRRARRIASDAVTQPVREIGLRLYQPLEPAKRFAITLACALAACSAGPLSARAPGDIGHASETEQPHHVSLLLGGTSIQDTDETALTTGIDYEYRVSEFVGLGFVAEQAFGKIDATTILAVADLHITKGLVVQVGPGIEFVDEEQFGVARIGAIYEFEIAGHLTLSPQLHYDATSHHDSVIFAVAIGRHF